MTTISLKLVVLLVATAGALSLATPLAIASPPPKLEGTMHWYRSQPSARMLEGRSSAVGTTAVVGLASMRALAPVQARYGIRVIAVFPQLRAAEVSVSRLLLSGAALDRRIRYLSPVG